MSLFLYEHFYILFLPLQGLHFITENGGDSYGRIVYFEAGHILHILIFFNYLIKMFAHSMYLCFYN